VVRHVAACLCHYERCPDPCSLWMRPFICPIDGSKSLVKPALIVNREKLSTVNLPLSSCRSTHSSVQSSIVQHVSASASSLPDASFPGL
jgi:hypothetical protein